MYVNEMIQNVLDGEMSIDEATTEIMQMVSGNINVVEHFIH